MVSWKTDDILSDEPTIVDKSTRDTLRKRPVPLNE